MIYNERQLKITASELKKLQQAKVAFDKSVHDQEPWIVDAQLRGLNSQIEDLEQQVTEYQLLRDSSVVRSECNDLSELPRILISARIAKGMSQKDLADTLGMSQQQIQRYEATDYMSASLSRLIEVANVLEIHIKELWGGEFEDVNSTVFSWTDVSTVDWSQFPLKEIAKREWFTVEDDQDSASAFENYFVKSAGMDYVSALHRKKFYGGRKPDEFGLLAWQARILEKANLCLSSREITEFEFDDSWIPDLVALSVNEDGPSLASEFLEERGVILVVEPHLTGTYLDGAAMLSHEGNPVIGMTLRHDRLDNFWFVLFHELGHVLLHLSQSLRFDFFDEEDGTDSDEIEMEADQFALDAFVPADIWERCISRFLVTPESVVRDAQKIGIHPSIIAGRIRRESNNYSVLHELLGSRSVRAQFGDQK
jgi:HTH-type transcriptional regulator/antitoxin HigA